MSDEIGSVAERKAIAELMHNYVVGHGFEDGRRRFVSTWRRTADIAESVTKDEFNKHTGATL